MAWFLTWLECTVEKFPWLKNAGIYSPRHIYHRYVDIPLHWIEFSSILLYLSSWDMFDRGFTRVATLTKKAENIHLFCLLSGGGVQPKRTAYAAFIGTFLLSQRKKKPDMVVALCKLWSGWSIDRVVIWTSGYSSFKSLVFGIFRVQNLTRSCTRLRDSLTIGGGCYWGTRTLGTIPPCIPLCMSRPLYVIIFANSFVVPSPWCYSDTNFCS